MKNESMYARIYNIVRMIPPGKVATYGQVSRIAGRCSARNVGYAMSSVPFGSDIPWHRVINSRGMISIRSYGEECYAQHQLLEGEGVLFSEKGRVNLDIYGWEGPESEMKGEANG
ncbi:MAG: MGMT family protein [Candidatus Aegiribacteria sp.]|nr:MGMT family protein [Candidatus Aegiribacteria sp.]